jgi:hypothetical protein
VPADVLGHLECCQQSVRQRPKSQRPKSPRPRRARRERRRRVARRFFRDVLKFASTSSANTARERLSCLC